MKMPNYKPRLKQFLYQPPWKCRVLSLALDALLLWQSAVDIYFYYRVNLLFARRRWVSHFKVPGVRSLPVRVGLLTTLIIFILIAIAPPVHILPAFSLLVLMGASFSLALTIAFLIPSSSPKAHWLKTSPFIT
jgi:hypothetical protein